MRNLVRHLTWGLSKELHLDLGALTLRPGASQNLDDASQSNSLFVHPDLRVFAVVIIHNKNWKNKINESSLNKL